MFHIRSCHGIDWTVAAGMNSFQSNISSNVSSPIGLSEFWESEPMWTCKNINSIHDQGRRYHYLDDWRSK